MSDLERVGSTEPAAILPGVKASTGLQDRASALWDAMASDPESSTFGGPMWRELAPVTRRFAVLALALVDEASPANVTPFIRCGVCLDSGMVRRERQGDAVTWYCMACDGGLRMCADFWRSRSQTPGGQRAFKDWSRANAIDARRVGAVMATEGRDDG